LSRVDFHSPAECSVFQTFAPLKFSHKRFFLIQIRKLMFRFRDNNPFLSQKTLSKITDYKVRISRNQLRVNRKKVIRAKSIYVKSDFLQEFLSIWGRQISAKVLVSGGSDTNFDKSIDLPPSIKLALIQNCSLKNHEIIRTLPIGLEDLNLGRSGLKKYHKHSDSVMAENKVLVPPMSNTNPIRRPTIIECMKKPKVFDVLVGLMHEDEYYLMCKKYRFILCLEGNGYENHRIWETLYQGSFPILLRTKWSESLEYLDLPILIVNSIDEVNAESLEAFRLSNQDFRAVERDNLWIQYWRKIVMNYSN
jgi:hypothetical protein